MNKRFQIYFYAPENCLDSVKNALFNAGAGNINNYSHCSWQTKGSGQYEPNEKATPFLGAKQTLCIEEEYKVEMICLEKDLKKVIHALKKNHPYEEPAFGVIKLEDY